MVFRIPTDDDALKIFGKPKESAFAEGTLRLLVWNVWKGKRGEAWRRDFLKLSLDRDLVLLQEAVTSDLMSTIFHQHAERHEWHLASSFKWRYSHATGVATGAIVSPKSRFFLRGSERELFVWTPKVSLGTLYDMPQGRPLLVINTHVVNFTTTASFIRFVEELVKMIASHKGPLILAGDFNTWNFRRWRSLLEILLRLGLDIVDFHEDTRVLKLDHIFVRGFRVTGATIRKDIGSSDHFPLLVEMERVGR